MTLPGLPQTELENQPAAPVPSVPRPATWPVAPAQRRRPPLGKNLRQVLATTFVAAYACWSSRHPAVETVVCPLSGHHLVGWCTWVQTALSAFVLLSGAALMAARDRLSPAP